MKDYILFIFAYKIFKIKLEKVRALFFSKFNLSAYLIALN